jgi:D-alanyl-D-alanine carboxypeptidase/D-alanyl-D-alanine-endopeptidase (penicillin-binding protein 4)
VLALAAAFLAVAAIAAAPASSLTLSQRLDRALTVSGVARGTTGAYALDLRSGRVVYRLHAAQPLRPASNQKLTVAVTALARLGAGYRFPTRVLGDGEPVGNVWRGRLVLKGFGDPSVSAGDLRKLAGKLGLLGIRHVTGRVIGDESYYDRRRTGPGWKPSWYKLESPPLSALVVGRAKVNGHTVDNPALAAARAFRAALRDAGISVAGKAVVGRAAGTATRLAAVRSRTLARLVLRMNKISDNFYAEMLLKHLGARFRDKGTTAAGASVVRAELRRRGLPLAGIRIADGSGLSPLDRLTARTVGRLLVSAYRDPAVKPALVASLPIAGVDGTLEDRLRTAPARRRVRAKTGTTDTASSLSGYVGTRWVFAILQNGHPIAWTSARKAQNRFARILARTLQ